MNRFRGKRKEKEEPSTSGDHSMPSLRGFLRSKKAPEEKPEPQIDIATALPTHDDFRTSLLMTGLSARFSMLREQDDPTSKIGKASDDSVLFPKRQSRMMDYGFNGGIGLNDIAEVESIRAPFSRMDSFASADDASSTKGSIMSRGKPTDGNNLFGGRQKIVVGSRTLYENDVSGSSFQKWRREERERERRALEDEEANDDSQGWRSRRSEEEASAARPESPSGPMFSRRRETSSTTASSLARNSTAATSIASQQSQATTASTASGAPVERSVTRTRRLYEQALNQDLHASQSTALSRIDTLTGKKSFTRGSPDPNSSTSPPMGFGFGERRPIMTKASAPNLRTTSPAASAASGSNDRGSNISNKESRFNFAGTPPLSPPISETGDLPLMAIQPNDVGKATAMGVFSKPAQPYDESKYAERQLQLKQGRETPTLRGRTESNATGLSIHTESKDTSAGLTFLDDSDDSPDEPRHSPIPPAVVLERPADSDHPAFRQDALPTPLSFKSQVYDPLHDPPQSLSKPDVFESPIIPQNTTPIDSPTLGSPGLLTTGLSGMVRQHMRSESSTSSIYGPSSSGLDVKFPAASRDSTVLAIMGDGLGVSNWQDQQWNPYEDEDAEARISQHTLVQDDTPAEPEQPAQSESVEITDNNTSPIKEEDPDDFANRVAIARRRVQERLTTSYLESAESSRAPSPQPQEREAPVPVKPSPFGILRGKSSRGSLADRNRSGPPRKALQTLGLGATTMSSSPSPSKQSFEDAGLPPMREEVEINSRVETTRRQFEDKAKEKDSDARSLRSTKSTRSLTDKDDEQTHPGLRAFRQARRQLQKQKELAVLARHQGQGEGVKSEESDAQSDTNSQERTPSRTRHVRRELSGDSYRSGASVSPARNERDRSGSEASTGRVPPRPPRLRNNSSPYENQLLNDSENRPRRPMLRSPGLPGTDIKRSPIMPPQPYPGAASSPKGFSRSASSGNLRVNPPRLGELAPISPIVPLGQGLPPSPRHQFVPPSPAANSPAGSTTNSTMNDAKKKFINKKDISDPTLVMSTSRVPTVNLPHSQPFPDSAGAGSDQRNAPPLPPINPRRTRGVMNGFLGRKNSDYDDETLAASSSPHLPLTNSSGSLGGSRTADDGRSAFSVSDDEEDKPASRWRLRKTNTEAQGSNSQVSAAPSMGAAGPFGPPRDTRAFVSAAPPVGRSVMTAPTRKPSALPGGMI
ncbi:hypothetical protein MCOR19_009326 [Pyricularia oryzae]|uniref:DUF4045 domain-containing protein n=1 Tax=Pyricularia grisea TaxID=148305 RepID=A0ABQ8NXK7_PYRGI|nr:hypothetical protein MCOR19_009326 [Pyricularia oryzae]KAI6303587.1 hypothetical protein MCOR33_001280 [Pyricularia grisea]KAI6479948.1 hypothetical protein MCOR18_005437 [Pyricularia oryzae]